MGFTVARLPDSPLLSDTCERSAGSLRLSTLLCNHKVQMTPTGGLKSSLSRAEPLPASSVRGEEKSIKAQPDQKDAQSQDTTCTHLGLLMTGEHCGVVYYMRLTSCQRWQRRPLSYTKKWSCEFLAELFQADVQLKAIQSCQHISPV